jgi:hypothetical protein
MSDCTCPSGVVLHDRTCPLWLPLDTMKSVTLNVEFQQVDPDLLGILTGGVMGNPPAPTFEIDVAYPARRRTFWEWLRHKPKHHAGFVYMPSVRLAEFPETEEQ